MGFLIFFCRTVGILLAVEEWALFLRVLLPFFVDEEESDLCLFLAAITEPFIIPVREILYMLNIGQDSPIDLSFSLTCLLIFCVRIFLPQV